MYNLSSENKVTESDIGCRFDLPQVLIHTVEN